MTLLEYIAALANKVNGIKPTPGMTLEERAAFDALSAKVDDMDARLTALEDAAAPLVGQIDGMPAL